MNRDQTQQKVGPSKVGNRIRIELDEAKARLEHVGPIIGVCGGVRVPAADRYYAATFEMARRLSANGVAVMSGGGPGIMEAANKGAKEGARGASIGLNINLSFETGPNLYQDIEVRFDHFGSRKAVFCKYTTAMVVMPGGFGTLDELFEILTLIQTEKTKVIPIYLFGREFWQGMLDWVQTSMVDRGLVKASDLALFEVVDSVDDLVERCLHAAKSR